MKWLRRDEWGGLHRCFGEASRACVFEMGPCNGGASVCYRRRLVQNVWGCAFEDFLTREYDDNRNIVDDYLKTRGWRESATNKAYMTALRSSVISLYEVSDIVSEESFLARNLVRGGDPIRISEKSATRSLHPWDVSPRGCFEHNVAEDLLDSIGCAGRVAREKSAEFARQIGREVNDPIIATTLTDTGALSLAAPLFTSFWLADALKAALDPPAIEIRNGDGEELFFSGTREPGRSSNSRLAAPRRVAIQGQSGGWRQAVEWTEHHATFSHHFGTR